MVSELTGATGTATVPSGRAGTQTLGVPEAPARTDIRYPAMSLSAGAGVSVTAALAPTTAVAGGGGTSSPVASARSVLDAVGSPGTVLSTTNPHPGDQPPASVPSLPRTDHV